MYEIDKYMTVGEAAHKWGKEIDTVKNYLKRSVKGYSERMDQMIAMGLIKYSKHPEAKKGVWIITDEAMEIWFNEKRDFSS